MEPSVFIPTIGVMFGSILGAYIYIHKVSNGVRDKSSDDKRALYVKLDNLTQSIQKLEISVTDRLARVETQLELLSPLGE